MAHLGISGQSEYQQIPVGHHHVLYPDNPWVFKTLSDTFYSILRRNTVTGNHRDGFYAPA